MLLLLVVGYDDVCGPPSLFWLFSSHYVVLAVLFLCPSSTTMSSKLIIVESI